MIFKYVSSGLPAFFIGFIAHLDACLRLPRLMFPTPFMFLNLAWNHEFTEKVETNTTSLIHSIFANCSQPRWMADYLICHESGHRKKGRKNEILQFRLSTFSEWKGNGPCINLCSIGMRSHTFGYESLTLKCEPWAAKKKSTNEVNKSHHTVSTCCHRDIPVNILGNHTSASKLALASGPKHVLFCETIKQRWCFRATKCAKIVDITRIQRHKTRSREVLLGDRSWPRIEGE